MLNGDNAGATKTIDGSDDAESAQGYYLKAIAAKRDKKDAEATSNISKAAAKDASFGEKATRDREFVTPVAVEKAAAAAADKK